MKIRCCKNEIEYPTLVIPINPSASMEPGDNFICVSGGATIFRELEHYEFTVGLEYYVYGILQYNNQIRYLTQNDFNACIFAPNALFEITDRSLPYDWSVNTYELEGGTLMIIGYDSLTDGYENLRGIADEEGWAVRKFLDYKEWLSKWM